MAGNICCVPNVQGEDAKYIMGLTTIKTLETNHTETENEFPYLRSYATPILHWGG